jgi:hypothetical protein
VVTIRMRGPSLGPVASLVALAIFLAAFIAVMLVIRPWDVDDHQAELDAAVVEARAIFAALPLPDGSVPAGPAEETATLKRGMRATIAREWDVPGTFAETVTRLGDLLGAAGWTRYAGGTSSVLVAEFCRAPHMLSLMKRASFEDETPPHHGLRLELTWAPGITEGHCRGGRPE